MYMKLAVPRAGGLPLVGNLPSLLRDPLATLRRASAVGDVSRLEFGLFDAVTLHHPEHADHVLRKAQRNYPKGGPYWSSIRDLLGNGLPTSTGAFWLRQRRMMQPQFHRRRLEGLSMLVADALDRSLTFNDVGRDFRVLDIGARMPHLTMNAFSASMFGAETSPRDSKAIQSALSPALDHIFRGMLVKAVPQWVPLPGRRRFQGLVDQLRQILRGMIQRRRHAISHSPDPEEHDDLLALMIHAVDEDTGEGMTEQQLLDEVCSLYLAGYETTATGLQWALYFLTTHPEHWERLREETDAVLRGRVPRFDDLRRLRYARWTMQEALRLNPPAWWTPRVAQEDDEIGGYRIEAGTIVAPVTYTIHRHPAMWVNPETFDPLRFEPERVAGRHPLAWMAFGAGAHRCIGQELSLMEGTMALALMTQRFDLQSVGHVTRPKLSTVIRASNGVRVKIRHRRLRSRATLGRPHFVASDSSSQIPI